MQLPESVQHMRELLGTNYMNGLRAVKAAQQKVAEWMVEATEAKHPKVWVSGLSLEEAHALIDATACERWPGIGQLTEDLKKAERAAYMSMEALA